MSSFFRQLSSGVAPGRLKFEVKMIIEELANIPMVNGYLFVKWKQVGGGSGSGFTQRLKIKNHSVIWKNEIIFEAVLTTDKETAILQSCPVQFSVRLETNGGKDFEKIGKVIVDLAEYAGSKPTSRKFLLLDSRLNSTLEITTSMRQTAGDPTFRVPVKHQNLHPRSANYDDFRVNSSSSGLSGLESGGSLKRDSLLSLSSSSLSPKSRRYHSLNLSGTQVGSGKSPTALVDEIFEQFDDPEDKTFPVSGKNLSVQRVSSTPAEPLHLKSHSRELSSNSASSATS